ncbi:MAG: hypothetical protein K6C40_15400 [Thermoguttaceae bacterium]|nr:hypothetical protein [Thermoguttaceae bacterium]
MTYTQQIETIRSQTLAMIAELTKNPKPSYKIEDQSVSWESYLARLQATVEWCNAQLAASDPVEIRTTAGS